MWVTRTRPEADALAGRLTTLGFVPVVEPLLEVAPTPFAPPAADAFDAIAVTSAHALDAAAAAGDRTRPLFTVGGATARAARARGFTDVRSADGDAEALARRIAADLPRGARIWHPAAREPARDLAGLLAPHGLACRTDAVYETRPRNPRVDLSAIDAVVIESPKAARRFAEIADGAPDLGRLCVVAISPRAAEPLARLPLASVGVAATPDEGALVSALSGCRARSHDE